jgi:hypothetical protein
MEVGYMFYLKTKQANGKVVNTEITDENVFTRCPECGRELPIDLVELFSDGEGDLYSLSVICSACTKKRKISDDVKITADGLALLIDVFCKAGYGEHTRDLFYRFNIDEICELAPTRYQEFVEALTEIAVDGGGL